MALLVQDSNQTQDVTKSVTPGVHKHILATIGARATPIFNFDDAEFLRSIEIRPLHASPVTVLLVVVENTKAPGCDLCHIRAALEGEQGIEIHTPLHKYASHPPDTTTPCPARKCGTDTTRSLEAAKRGVALRTTISRPRMRATQKIPEPGRIPDRRSAGDRVDPVLGLLGINPKGLGPDFASLSGVTPTPPGNIKQISSLVLTTSVTIYRRSEAYRRWRQKT